MIVLNEGEPDACVGASVASAGWRLRSKERAPQAMVLSGQPRVVVQHAIVRHAMRSLEAFWMVAGAGVWLLAVTVGSALVLGLGFDHPAAAYDPTLRATAETVISLCTIGATWLLLAQSAHSRRVRDLLLFAGLLMLALLHLICYALPAVLNLKAGSSFAAAVVWGNVSVAATFAAAALVPTDRVVPSGGAPHAIAAALGVLAVGVAELGGMLLHSQLVLASTRPIEGIVSAWTRPVGVVLVLVAGGLFVVAGVVFARQALIEQLKIRARLAGASVVLAASALYGLALPALPPNWVAPSLGLRLSASVLVFVAVLDRELEHRTLRRLAAVTAERRRVAGNLHDGLAQDLAFIVAHGKLLATHLGVEHPLTVAVSRSLAVSRAAITELSDSSGRAIHEALESVTRKLSHRFAIGITLDCRLDAELDPDIRERAVRIVREAIVNAARHGGAKHVSVSLNRTGEGIVLRVRDDGCGIAHAASDRTGEGFGLQSMRERAAVRGGCLILSEPANGGTELEAVLPFAAS